MPTKLDNLLEQIAPERTFEQASTRADTAFNSFHFPSGRIARPEEFADLMGRFLHHVEMIVLGVREPVDVAISYQWQRCAMLLIQAFGPSGDKTAFSLAHGGAEGGLYGILKTVARLVADQYARRVISARVLGYLNGLSADERLRASAEYLEKWGHLLPRDVTEVGATRIHALFHRVLEEHPHHVQRLCESSRRLRGRT